MVPPGWIILHSGNVIFPLVNFQWAGQCVFARIVVQIYKGHRSVQSRSKNIGVAVTYVTVLRDEWFSTVKISTVLACSIEDECNMIALTSRWYMITLEAHERGDPNFWDAWQGQEAMRYGLELQPSVQTNNSLS